jgi:multidrug transporter EmrE-like cation transporter
MKTALLIVFVVVFMVSNAWSAMLFKFAADASGKKALWYYVIGNLIAALGPLALTFALKRANPNLIYAVCYGTGFAAIQITASRLFHQPLSTFQWAGIASVGLGICLLQFGQK